MNRLKPKKDNIRIENKISKGVKNLSRLKKENEDIRDIRNLFE